IRLCRRVRTSRRDKEGPPRIAPGRTARANDVGEAHRPPRSPNDLTPPDGDGRTQHRAVTASRKPTRSPGTWKRRATGAPAGRQGGRGDSGARRVEHRTPPGPHDRPERDRRRPPSAQRTHGSGHGPRQSATCTAHAADRPSLVPILSPSVEWPTGDGRRIVASHDSSLESYPGAPHVIIAPGYGETKTDYVTLAYYLAANGFHVLRYDHTNHVGESDGEMSEATLSSMNQDLGTVLDYANRTRPTSPIVVIAANVTGRIALKRLAQDHRVALLVV